MVIYIHILLYYSSSIYVFTGIDNTGAHVHNDECNTAGSGSRKLGYQVSSTGNVYTTFTSDASQSASELGFKMYMISGKDFCEYIYIAEENRRLLENNIPNKGRNGVGLLCSTCQQYFSYIVVVSFNGGGNRRFR